MRIFQTVFFIIEIIVYLGIGGVIAVSSKRFFGDRYVNKSGNYSTDFNYCYLYEDSIIKRPKKKTIPPLNIIWFIIVFSITTYLIKPYILDIPQLVTGRLTYVTDYVQDAKVYRKDLHHYVYLSRGKAVKFFFITDIRRGEEYKIGYLTNSKRAIYCEKIGGKGSTSHENKVMGFPFKEILIVMLIIGITILLIIIAPFLKLKVFIPTTIVCSFIYIFYFIRYGLRYGLWISQYNKAFLAIVIHIISVFIMLSMVWLQKRKDMEYPIGYLFAQAYTVLSIGSCIELVSNIPL